MSTNYAVNYQPNVATRYTHKSFTRGLAKAKFNWDGAKSIAIYSHTAPTLGDYSKTSMAGSNGVESRYGNIQDIDMVTQTIEVKLDKAASFTCDALDMATTAGALKANEVLRSFTDETAIPYFDKYVLKTWYGFAGDYIKVASLDSTSGVLENAATWALQTASEKFFESLIDGEKVCLCTPEFFKHLKRSDYFTESLQGSVVYKGQLGELDGWKIIVVPKAYMPTATTYALCVDPKALVCEEKLSEYKVIGNSERVSGALINVRQCFVAGADFRKASGIIAIGSVDDPRPSTEKTLANYTYSTKDSSLTAGQVIAAGLKGTDDTYGVYLDTSDTGYIHGRWSKLLAVST